MHIFRLLFTWGSNSFGQLGYGEFDTNEPLPKLAKKLATKFIVQISCGDHHNLALTNGMSNFRCHKCVTHAHWTSI